MKEQSSQHQLGNRLTQWARGELEPTAQPSVIFAAENSVDWLADSATGVVGEATIVFVRTTKGTLHRSGAAGSWLGCRGTLDEPGDEIQIGSDLWLQSVDYHSSRLMAVAGPTVIRLADADDAALFVHDVSEVRARGYIESTLLLGAIEIGDRCALSDRRCTASGMLSRLHVDDLGVVRTTPTGLPLGRVGQTLSELADAGRRLAADGVDPCLDPTIAAVVDTVSVSERIVFLNALDAVRTMTLRTGQPWSVSGIHGRVALSDPGGDVLAPRPDLILLWSDSDCVLFDANQRRAFAVSREAADVLDICLHSIDGSAAVQRLSGQSAPPENPAAAVRAVTDAFAARGVQLWPAQ